VAGVVVGRIELVEQHERRVIILEGIGYAVVVGIGSGRVRKLAPTLNIGPVVAAGGLTPRTAAGETKLVVMSDGVALFKPPDICG